ncbi:MAG: hypothetical protein V4695_06040 [Pseudomonadota bacterium]
MKSELASYRAFTSPARLNKSINGLVGLIEGISIDGLINTAEVAFLDRWLAEHRAVLDKHPFNELAPVVQAAIADGLLTEEERLDILWLCKRLTSTEFYDQTTADLQRLHAVVGGIIADGHISTEELRVTCPGISRPRII